MRLPIGLLALALMLLAVAGCATKGGEQVMAQSRGWDFVQSAGGLTVGTPAREPGGHVLLPIRFDVATARSDSASPTSGKFGLICEAPVSRVDGNQVFVTVETSAATKARQDTRCPAA